jgi:hypothetical protein
LPKYKKLIQHEFFASRFKHNIRQSEGSTCSSYRQSEGCTCSSYRQSKGCTCSSYRSPKAMLLNSQSSQTVTTATFTTQHMNGHKRNILHMAHQQFQMQHFTPNTETGKNAIFSFHCITPLHVTATCSWKCREAR